MINFIESWAREATTPRRDEGHPARGGKPLRDVQLFGTEMQSCNRARSWAGNLLAAWRAMVRMDADLGGHGLVANEVTKLSRREYASVRQEKSGSTVFRAPRFPIFITTRPSSTGIGRASASASPSAGFSTGLASAIDWESLSDVRHSGICDALGTRQQRQRHPDGHDRRHRTSRPG